MVLWLISLRLGLVDFLHVVASIKFFIYTVGKPNPKNGIIWAENLNDISNDARYRQVGKFLECLVSFLDWR